MKVQVVSGRVLLTSPNLCKTGAGLVTPMDVPILYGR